MKKILPILIMMVTQACTIDPAQRIAQTMNDAIAAKEIPGGVVLITHKGKTLYHEAFGNLMVTPHILPAHKDSLYELTSITKLFTATLVMQLHDEGKLDVTKPVANYLESFRGKDKMMITIEQLLTHRSGLPIIIPTPNFTHGLATAVERIGQATLEFAPGTRYLYSDLGPITASYIAEKVIGKPFEQLLQEYIFAPLDLKDTLFSPAKSRSTNNIAPTNTNEGELRHGLCWSPRSWALGGVGGSSGLFSTAADLEKFAQLFLNDGVVSGKRLLSNESIKLMITSRPDIPRAEKRGIGFDINTDSAFARGTIFDQTSFGHTGTSGTTLWIDPTSQTVVIVLGNRFHPKTSSDFKAARITIATLAARMVEKD
jgi:CubicO group peptidase (beta-lactamase class C family)